MASFNGGNTYHLREAAANSYTPAAPEPDAQTSDGAREEILQCLSFTAIAVDELVRATNLGVPLVLSVLLELELAGRVRRLPGNRVVLAD
jgi:DNA processing protein